MEGVRKIIKFDIDKKLFQKLWNGFFHFYIYSNFSIFLSLQFGKRFHWICLKFFLKKMKEKIAILRVDYVSSTSTIISSRLLPNQESDTLYNYLFNPSKRYITNKKLIKINVITPLDKGFHSLQMKLFENFT